MPSAAAPASSAPMDASAIDLIDAIAEGRADAPPSDSTARASPVTSPDEGPKQQQTSSASASLNQPSVQQSAGRQQSAEQGAQKPKVELHMSTAVSR